MTKITREKLLEYGFVEGQYKDTPYFRKGENVVAYSCNEWVPCKFLNGSLVYRDFCANYMEELEFLMKDK